MRYTITFNCRLENMADNKLPVEAEWIADARAMLDDTNTWYNYILSSFENSMNDDGGEGLPMPEICGMFVSLVDTKEPSFSGSLSWHAEEVDYDKLLQQLEWFIGDRMCFYEVVGDDWHCFVNLDGLVTSSE